MSTTKFHKMFNGRKLLPTTEMNASLITGGTVTLANKLTREHGWNGSSLLKNDVDYAKSPVAAHLFHAGLATFMAKAGYSDKCIIRIGLWHSSAFKA